MDARESDDSVDYAWHRAVSRLAAGWTIWGLGDSACLGSRGLGIASVAQLGALGSNARIGLGDCVDPGASVGILNSPRVASPSGRAADNRANCRRVVFVPGVSRASIL